MNEWKKVWANRDVFCESNIDFYNKVIELKKLNGFDVIEEGISYEAFYKQYLAIKNELSFNAFGINKIQSVFEVGCGSGANLLFFEKDGIDIGGVDYSKNLILSAKNALKNVRELYVDEAKNISVTLKYDAVFSNSVFSYFESYEYALEVLNRMFSKAVYSIGILDIHDLTKKDEFISYRRKTIKNYDDKYKNLNKLFYPKTFFLDFAEKNGMDVRFSHSRVEGYWNNDYIYNVYMTKFIK